MDEIDNKPNTREDPPAMDDTDKTPDFHEPPLPFSTKMSYALSNAGSGLMSGLGLGQIMYFYTKVFKLDPVLQGWAWIIFAIWNAVNDPLIGILQERTKSKLGRRVPYLRYGSFLYAGLFVLVWFPFAPPGNQPLLFLNLLVVLFCFDTVYSMIGLVTYSLPAEMTITSEERGNLMVYSSIFGFLPQVLGFALPLALLKGSNLADIWQWQVLMLIIAVIAGAILFIGSYYIRENRWAQKEETLGFIESIVETVKNKQFLILEAAHFPMLIVQTILTGGIAFLFEEVYVASNSTEYLFLVPAVIILLSTILLFNHFIPKIGIKKLFIIGSLVGAAGFGMLPLFPRTFAGLAIPLSCAAVGLAALIISNQLLMSDVIDYDEIRTGKRRETTYSGVNALITKPAISIANWLFLGILALFGYDEDLPDQPSSVADGVILAYTVIPIVCVAIAVTAMYFYKLDGPGWQKKKRKLQEIHHRKEMEYLRILKEADKL